MNKRRAKKRTTTSSKDESQKKDEVVQDENVTKSEIKVETKKQDVKATVKNQSSDSKVLASEAIEKKTKTTTSKPKNTKPNTKKVAVEKTTTIVKKKVEEQKTSLRTSLKTNIFVEFGAKKVSSDEILNIVKEDWVNSYDKKVGDIKILNMYYKPEESTVYYVVNEEFKGSVVI